MPSKRKVCDTGEDMSPSKKAAKLARDNLSDTKELDKEEFLSYLEKKMCKECKQELQVAKSYNIKRHFEKCHPGVVAKLLVEYRDREAARAKSKITNYIRKTPAAENELVNLFSSAPVSMNLIENKHLQKLLSYIPNFKPPKLRKLRALMFSRLQNLIEYVKDNCAGKYYAIGTDCGTTKGMIYSYLADVFETPELLAVRKAVFATINHFARSHQASSQLYERSKFRLLFPAATRWSTLTITYERVLKLKDHINIIALENGWPTLSKQTVDAIHNVVLLTKDIADFTTQIQSDARPTISLLFPGLHNIKINLHQKKCEVREHSSIDFEEVIDNLIKSIDKRFSDILSTNDESGDPLFAAATLLDSTTAGIFPNLEDLTLQQTKRIFHATSKKLNIEEDMEEDPAVSPEMMKKNPLGFAIKQPTINLTSTKKSFGKEITEFHTIIKEGNWCYDDPIKAWFMHKNQFPKLFEIAMAILPIPATSAAVERMFSHLKIHTDGHKNRSKSQLTKLRVLLSCNKNLFDKLVVEKIL
uniref:HAT C-terminal dimerisation domain-containing protein n=1 Tax=Panagrolaimus sp. ES5 TaxID=591445 RepID=A0AC34G4P7_9BILA